MTPQRCVTLHKKKREHEIEEFLEKYFFIGPWIVIIKDNKNIEQGYVDNGVEEHKQFACQHHFVVENVCNNTGQNLTVILHTLRFHGKFEFRDESNIKKN